MRIFILLLMLINIGLLTAYCQSPEFVKEIYAVRVDEQPRIDGLLSEKIWQRTSITAFYQREPNQGMPASETTEVWVAYDNAALYIAAKMTDSQPDSIIARLARRDNEIGADEFLVRIDSYHDHRNGYFFGVSAAGTLRDGILFNDDWSNDTWDGVWEGKAQRTTDGWCVEMRIPFSQLRFENKEQHIWGINFERIIGRKKEEAYLVYTPRNESGFVSRFPHLMGIEHITPPARFEATPYITTRAEYLKHKAGDPFNDGSKYTPDIGVDFKWGLGTNLTLDGTINPDFGQVEVDPAVVNLSDVETYYSEKRPFFIEGMNIFSFGQGGVNSYWQFNWSSPNLFYSRRIGRTPQRGLPYHDFADVPLGTRILAATKLTGKIFDKWNIGIIEAVTNREYAKIDTSGVHWKWEIEPLASYTVGRIQRDFNDGGQGIGILTTYTRRFFSDNLVRSDVNEDAICAGIDAWTALDSEKEYMISGWTSLSYVRGTRARILSLQQSAPYYFQRPDANHVSVDSNATSMSGYAGRITLNKQKGRVMLNSAIGFVSPGFNTNDIGYVTQTDIINYHIAGGYKWNDPTEYYRYIEVYGSYFSTLDFGGNALWRGVWGRVNYKFPNYHTIGLYYNYGFRSVNNRLTRGGPLVLYVRGYQCGFEYYTDSRSDYIAQFYGYAYEGMDGFYHNLNSYLTMRPTSYLSVSIGPGYVYSLDRVKWIDGISDITAIATYCKRYIFADLNYKELSAQIRINWTFTPTLSLQLFIQPLLATGSYTSFKELARPRTFDFNEFGKNGSSIEKNINSDGSVNYVIDPDGIGPAQVFSISDPNFRSVSLRGNAVLRWEYMPGSALYIVWTQSRYESDCIGTFAFNESVRRLADTRPDNIFMLKLTYWFGS